MQTPILVILAAGMGSRFGGLKQMEPIDAYGNLLIDYSIFDAVQAGFSKVICIIKEDMRQDFDAVAGERIRAHVPMTYAYQALEMLPGGFSVPAGREKPWGTAHAMLCCKAQIDRPFAIINADDYYGPSAYSALYAYLCARHSPGEQAMVGYAIENTLTDFGTVTRGVCKQNQAGFLVDIKECRGVGRHADGASYEEDGRRVIVPPGTLVSMNMWGFYPDMLGAVEAMFPVFLQTAAKENPLKSEFLLPDAMQALLRAGEKSCRILSSHDHWFGVTYREDLLRARLQARMLREGGVYPQKLWN